MLVDPAQAARVATLRREVQAKERERHVAAGAGPGEQAFEGRCRFCERRFPYVGKVIRFPTGQVHHYGGPRTVCDETRCVDQCEAERRAAELAAHKLAVADALERRRAEYTKWVPAMYHAEARIAPASLGHVVAKLKPWEPTKSLYLHGPSSSGKSHQLASLMHGVAGRVSMEWYSTRHLLSDAQTAIGSKGKLDRPGILDDPCRCLVLVLNDVFAEATSSWAATTIGNVIDKRYEAGLPIVFSSNVGIDEIEGTAEGSRHNIATVRLELKRIAERILEMTTAPFGMRLELANRNWRHDLAEGKFTEGTR